MTADAPDVATPPADNAAVAPSVSGRTLILLRHGRTEHNERGIWQGHLDTALSATGVRQARFVGPRLALYAPALIVTSDLARARCTAEAIGASLGLPVQADERLREIHCGAWQGLSRAEVVARFPDAVAATAAGHDVRRGGHGESVAMVVRRARPAIDDVVRALASGECAVVVTHGVTARGLAGDLLGLDAPVAWRMLGSLDNCAWARLDETETGWRLGAWNAIGEAATGLQAGA